MDTNTVDIIRQSSWARQIEANRLSDQRQQPWKAAFDVESKAKLEGTYEELQDVTKDAPKAPPPPTH